MIVFIVAYIIFATLFNQFYKLTTRTMKNAAAQTAGLQVVAGIGCFLLLPFFEFRFPTNPWVYFFLALSCVFYALNNYIMATVRKKLEASVIGILQQSYTVLMTIAGFILYNDQATATRIIGILLIILANIMVFFRNKKTETNKYVWFGFAAYTCNVIAGIIDINYSDSFNIAFYSGLLYFVPAIFIFIGGRLKISDAVKEFKRARKRDYFMTGFCWGWLYLCLLIAYRLGEVSVVASLASLTVFSNVIVGYFWLKERDAIAKKILAAILAIVGVVLLSL